MKTYCVLLFQMLALTLCGQAGEHRETIRRELRFERPGAEALLIVQNISGGILVEGYDGAVVQLEVVRTITGKTAADAARGREEVRPGVLTRGGVIACYFDTPCSRPDSAAVTEADLRDGWDWHWKRDCDWDPDYEWQFDYRLRVPRGTALRLSTVNEGDIVVRDVEGRLQVNNVNGAIALERVAGAAEARTINGNLSVRYARNPGQACSFYTLNGRIDASFQPGLGAELHFKTFNGEFYTDLADVQHLPPALEREERPAGEGIRYKVGGGPALRVRGGGVRLDFETFNGNAYVREETGKQ